MDILRFGQHFMPFVLTAALIGVGTSAFAQPRPAAALQAEAQSLVARFDDAMQAYERNHWSLAFEAFLALAEQGHVDAARLMMQMHWHGTRLYGQSFALTPLQLERFRR